MKRPGSFDQTGSDLNFRHDKRHDLIRLNVENKGKFVIEQLFSRFHGIIDISTSIQSMGVL